MMHRFLLLIATALLNALAGGEATRPNIVVILADDLGWRDLSCQGSSWFRTPHLDRLAVEGVRLTSAYSASPLCSPTRASILTGQWPARWGITSPSCHLQEERLQPKLTKKAQAWSPAAVVDTATRLRSEAVTDAELLGQAGYATAHFGKWHLGRKPYDPLHQGFSVAWPNYFGPGPAGSYMAPWKFPNDVKITKAEGNIEARTVREAEQFIAKHAGKEPFLIHYWAWSVHTPIDADPKRLAEWKQKQPSDGQRSPHMGAMVEELDDAVGRLRAALEKAGVLDNTLIIFTSDNGGAQHITFDGIPVTENTPLAGGKAMLSEGGVRIPMIVRWPAGGVRPGAVSEQLAATVDLLPTLLEAAGISPPRDLDGVSLLPLLRNDRAVRDCIFWHFPHTMRIVGSKSLTTGQGNRGTLLQAPAAGVRVGALKLLRTFHGIAPGQHRHQLFDVVADPGETTDLAATRADDVALLAARLDAELQDTGALIPGPNTAYAPGASNDTDDP